MTITAGNPPLDPKGLLVSDLWVDAFDAHDQLAARRAQGLVTEDEAAGLAQFIDEGYLTIDLGVDTSTCERIQESVEQLWREKPHDVAFAYRAPLQRMSDLPYYQFEPGVWRFDPQRFGDEDAKRQAQHDLDECERAGLEVERFLPRRGHALLWHHSLLHGGSYPEDPRSTRKSFVVHYATLENQESARISIQEGGELRTYESFEVMARGEAFGYQSPLRSEQSAPEVF